MDSRNAFISGIAIGIVAVAIILFLRSLLPGDTVLEITGYVTEKMVVSTGHNSNVYVVKLEVAHDRYVYLAISAQVYAIIVTGVEYRFFGNNYNAVEEINNE